MESSEFEIISPATLQSVDINWLLCFICQTNNGENLVNPTEKKGKSLRFVHKRACIWQTIDTCFVVLQGKTT